MKIKNRKFKLIAGFSLLLMSLFGTQSFALERSHGKVVIPKEVLKDKIKGDWVAQTVGVTLGLPFEFKHNSAMIPDKIELKWDETSMPVEFEKRPGTYDDIYMDLSCGDPQ